MLLPEIIKGIWHGTSPEYPVRFKNKDSRLYNYIVHMEQAGIVTVLEDKDGYFWVARTHLGQSIIDSYMIHAGVQYLLEQKDIHHTGPYPKKK